MPLVVVGVAIPVVALRKAGIVFEALFIGMNRSKKQKYILPLTFRGTEVPIVEVIEGLKLLGRFLRGLDIRTQQLRDINPANLRGLLNLGCKGIPISRSTQELRASQPPVRIRLRINQCPQIVSGAPLLGGLRINTPIGVGVFLHFFPLAKQTLVRSSRV